MRHRRLPLLLLVVVLAGVGAFVLLSTRGGEVSMTTLVRLAPGMSEAEVATILGDPAADFTSMPPEGVSAPPPGGRLLHYAGRLATATIEFTPDGRLVRLYQHIRVVTLIERLRSRLNLW